MGVSLNRIHGSDRLKIGRILSELILCFQLFFQFRPEFCTQGKSVFLCIGKFFDRGGIDIIFSGSPGGKFPGNKKKYGRQEKKYFRTQTEKRFFLPFISFSIFLFCKHSATVFSEYVVNTRVLYKSLFLFFCFRNIGLYKENRGGR